LRQKRIYSAKKELADTPEEEPETISESMVSEVDENMDESPEEDISQIFSTEDTSSYDEKKEEIVSKEEFAEPLLNFNTKNTDKTEDETEDIFDFIGVKLDENQPPLENPSEELEIEETLEPAMEESTEPELAEDPFDSEEIAETEETEDALPEEGGPRIIKLSEHKKSQVNYTGIFKLVGLAALLLLMVGGGWWVYNQYFGAHSGPTASQNIVLPSIPQEAQGQTAQGDEDAIFQSGVSIPLGSAADDPAPVASTEEAIADATEQPSPTQDIVASSEPSTPAASEVRESPPPAPTTTQPTTTATTQPATTARSDDVYGLRGATRDIQGFVYAIIVHSLPSQNAANAECDKIVASGLRCIVREVTRPNGGTTYRVGIGQFPTMGAAQEQVSSLEEPFRSRNFVARVN
jgi:cell division septation protein DedD